MILFLFHREAHLCPVLDSVYKWYYMAFVFVWLTSLSMIVSSCIHVATNDIISFFFITEQYSIVCVCMFVYIYIYVCVYVCVYVWLQSMGSLGVKHDWATSLSLFTFMHWRRKWQPTPVFLPGESQQWQSLVSCCLRGRTESNTTEVT